MSAGSETPSRAQYNSRSKSGSLKSKEKTLALYFIFAPMLLLWGISAGFSRGLKVRRAFAPLREGFEKQMQKPCFLNLLTLLFSVLLSY
jgi:hypothetical protein